jgi:predicted nucleic acid-binding protein
MNMLFFPSDLVQDKVRKVKDREYKKREINITGQYEVAQLFISLLKILCRQTGYSFSFMINYYLAADHFID